MQLSYLEGSLKNVFHYVVELYDFFEFFLWISDFIPRSLIAQVLIVISGGYGLLKVFNFFDSLGSQ